MGVVRLEELGHDSGALLKQVAPGRPPRGRQLDNNVVDENVRRKVPAENFDFAAVDVDFSQERRLQLAENLADRSGAHDESNLVFEVGNGGV